MAKTSSLKNSWNKTVMRTINYWGHSQISCLTIRHCLLECYIKFHPGRCSSWSLSMAGQLDGELFWFLPKAKAIIHLLLRCYLRQNAKNIFYSGFKSKRWANINKSTLLGDEHQRPINLLQRGNCRFHHWSLFQRYFNKQDPP